MFSTLKNAFRVREIRSKIIYTLFIILIFRLGCHVMVPFLNPDAVQAAAESSQGTLSTYLGLLTGGAFQNATLFPRQSVVRTWSSSTRKMSSLSASRTVLAAAAVRGSMPSGRSRRLW